MRLVRDHLYVLLMNLAAKAAPAGTREIHNRIIHLGVIAYSDELDASIHAGWNK